jgi:hypothetical protein
MVGHIEEDRQSGDGGGHDQEFGHVELVGQGEDRHSQQQDRAGDVGEDEQRSSPGSIHKAARQEPDDERRRR